MFLSPDRMTYTPTVLIRLIMASQGDDEEIKRLIKAAWDQDCEDFFIGLDLSTNPTYDYGLTSVPAIEEEDEGDPGTLTFEQFHNVALNLASGTLNTRQVQQILEECALSANVTEWNLWYRRILLKTLHKHLPIDVIRAALLSLTTG